MVCFAPWTWGEGMKIYWKWAGHALALVLLLVTAALATVEIAAGQIIAKRYVAEERAFAVPVSANVAEGERIARSRGCYDGCHGKGAGGQQMMGLVAANLTRKAREYSDTDLERVIRQGVRPDGTSVFLMSSDSFSYLSDEDLGHVIAFLRSLPEDPNDPGLRSVSFMPRMFLAAMTHLNGWNVSAASRISKDTPPELTPRDAPPEAFGRYLAFSTCTECHGLDLFGSSDGMPDLMITSSYSADEFRRLMSTGESLDGRDLGLMSEMGARRFTHFAEAEVSAIYAYLTSDEFLEAERN